MTRSTAHIGILLALALAGCEQAEPPIEVDILITGGTVYDGTGAPGKVTDVAISGDEIAFVGDSDGANIQAARTIDASGLVVSPGFIDPHTHSFDDLQNPERSINTNYLTQGVTTVFNGNDGRGPVENRATREAMETQGIGTNTALFVGHGTVREAVLGLEDVQPTDAQLTEMQEMVDRAMQEGALGLSSGLYYVPGTYSETPEVVTLAKVIAPYGGVYESHIRDESSYTIGLLAAVDETIAIGEEAGVPAHFGHIKALGVDVWGQSAQVIEKIEAARARGVRVTADQYPWEASGSSIEAALVEHWAQEGGHDAVVARLEDPEIEARMRIGMAENMRRRGGADKLLLRGGLEEWIGKTLAEYATERGEDPLDTAIHILRNGNAAVTSFNMNDEDIEAFMVQPWTVTSSDGSEGHPRKYASFPKKYRVYVKEKGLLDLATFIHRSSGLTASLFRLCDRGRIAEDMAADIVIFDPEGFRENATYYEAYELSSGVEYLLVNGGLAIDGGEVTGLKAGRGLARSDGACE